MKLISFFGASVSRGRSDGRTELESNSEEGGSQKRYQTAYRDARKAYQ